MIYTKNILPIGLFIFLLLSCINPFSPKLDEDLGSGTSLISDQKQIEGIFQNLQYAYTFKDTTIYSGLLSSNFTFAFRDYDEGIDKTWGRDEEMRITHSLFNNAERLDLIWNNIVAITSDSTTVVRGFNLTITFNPTDVIFVDGRVNLQLAKNNSEGKWQIITWIDESNF